MVTGGAQRVCRAVGLMRYGVWTWHTFPWHRVGYQCCAGLFPGCPVNAGVSSSGIICLLGGVLLRREVESDGK